MSREAQQNSDPKMSVQTAILAVMSEAAYNGKEGSGNGKFSKDRINNALADAAIRFP